MSEQTAAGRTAEALACSCGGRVVVSAEPPPQLLAFWAAATAQEAAAEVREAARAPRAVHPFPLNGSVRAVAARPPARATAPPRCEGAATPVIFPCHAASVELPWLTRVLLAGCEVREVCFDELAALSERVLAGEGGGEGGGEGEGEGGSEGGGEGGGARAALRGVLCERTVFVLQDAQLGAAAALLGAHGYAPKAFALVHISHSFMYQAEAAAAAARYGAWRVAFRNNWFADSGEEGAPHSLAAAAARREVSWYP